jgi:hypothetical protein
VSLYGSAPDLRAFIEGRPMRRMGCGGRCLLCCWEYTESGRLVRPAGSQVDSERHARRLGAGDALTALAGNREYPQ